MIPSCLWYASGEFLAKDRQLAANFLRGTMRSHPGLTLLYHRLHSFNMLGTMGARSHAHAGTRTHMHTHTHARTHAHTNTHTQTHTDTHRHIHTHTHTRTHMFTCSQARSNTRECMRTQANANARTLADTQNTHPDACTRATQTRPFVEIKLELRVVACCVTLRSKA